jgi:transposase
MTLAQLTTLVKFLRGDSNSLAVKAAKLVLVDGLSQTQAATKLNTKLNTVNNGIKRYREANERIRRVYCSDFSPQLSEQ